PASGNQAVPYDLVWLLDRATITPGNREPEGANKRTECPAGGRAPGIEEGRERRSLAPAPWVTPTKSSQPPVFCGPLSNSSSTPKIWFGVSASCSRKSPTSPG